MKSDGFFFNRLSWLGIFLMALCLISCVDDTNNLASQYNGDEDGSPSRMDEEEEPAGESDSGESVEKSDLEEKHSASPHEVSPWAIAVVGTDYYSTSISILDRESRTLFRENIVHSGSASSGLSVALSGDVVFPRTYNHKNWIVLLDRYPNSVLTFVDPNDFSVIGQLPVATGFASNPHDFLWLSENKAYVTRYETNPTPGTEPYDGGDDILIVDPVARKITGRIELSQYTDNDSAQKFQARPDRMAYADGIVWVTLDHLTKDFDETGEGRVVGIDTTTDIVTDLVRLETLSNCTGIVYVAEKNALFLSCSGLFASGTEGQLAHSGIVRIDLNGDEPEVSILHEANDERKMPYGFDLDVVAGRWLLATRFGDIEADISDVAVLIDLESGEETLLHTAGSAYGLGGLLADDTTGTIYIGDADPQSPGIYLYTRDGDSFVEDGKIQAHPNVGLPPRHIRFY